MLSPPPYRWPAAFVGSAAPRWPTAARPHSPAAAATGRPAAARDWPLEESHPRPAPEERESIL